jgi:hypothetical protein
VNYWAPGDTAAREVDAFGEGVGWLYRGPYGCCIDGLPAYLAGARIDGKVYGVLGVGHQPLPLQVGNFWEYRSVDPFDPSRFRMTVVGDTTMPNGRTYSVLDGSIFPSKYLRTEGSSVFAYGAEDSIEYTQFDGNALVGDTMAFLGHPMQGGIVLSASTLDSNWKSWIWQFVYYWGTPEGWYEGVDWLVQDSVGVVRMMVEPGNAYSLQGARIGGDTIGTVVSVEERAEAAAEDPYLSQNYPNPFNAITKLVYGLPEDTHVSVEVFDVLGQRVATLFDGEQRTGVYQVVFDADGLSSGPYICRLRAGSFMRARTLMLLR